MYSLDSADIPPLRTTLVLLLILSALSRRLQGRAALINCSVTCLFPKSYSFRSIHYHVSPLVKDVGLNTSGVPSSKTFSLLYSAAGISQSCPVSDSFTLYRDMCPLGTSEITPFRRKQGPQAFLAFCCKRAGGKGPILPHLNQIRGERNAEHTRGGATRQAKKDENQGIMVPVMAVVAAKTGTPPCSFGAETSSFLKRSCHISSFLGSTSLRKTPFIPELHEAERKQGIIFTFYLIYQYIIGIYQSRQEKGAGACHI